MDRRVVRVVALVVIAGGTAVLLTSVGGLAIYASPILLPLNWWACSSSRSLLGRGLFALLGGAVAAEVTWAIGWWAGVQPPGAWLWVVIFATVAVVTVAYWVTASRHRARRGERRPAVAAQQPGLHGSAGRRPRRGETNTL